MKPPYSVEINFDKASEAWHKNKKKLSSGCYKYICAADTIKGTPCQKKPTDGASRCFIHREKTNQ